MNEVLVSIAIVSRIAESSLVDLPELFISLIFEESTLVRSLLAALVFLSSKKLEGIVMDCL